MVTAAPTSAQLEASPNATRPIGGVVSGLFIVSVGHFAVDLCSGIWPVYKTLAALDLTKAGLVATLGSVIGNGLQPFFGILSDRGWRKASLILGVLLSGAVLFVPYVSRYAWLFALVLLTAVGSAAFHPAGAGAASLVSGKRTGVMLAVFLMGGYVGYAISQVAFTATYRALDGSTGPLFLVPLLSCLGVAYWVPSSRCQVRTHSDERMPLLRTLTLLRVLFAVQLLSGLVNVAVIFLMPDLLMSRGSPGWLVHGGGHAALVLGGALSLFPAGHAADRLGARKVLVTANLLSGLFLLGLLFGPRSAAFELAMALGLGAFNGANGVVAVAEGNRMFPGRASAVSSLLMGLPWCLASLAPWFAGMLADPRRGGTPGHALAWIALSIPVALLCSSRVIAHRGVTRQAAAS